MASVALSVVGSAIGGPVGGMIGGFIGGMIDNVLFPQPQPPLPKITSSTYGNPIPGAYGPKVRLGTNMILTSGWRKSRSKANKLASLKGAPPAYECDLAFLVGDATTIPWQSSWAVKLFANGNTIFDSTLAVSPPTIDAHGVATWPSNNKTHKDFDTLVVYPGNRTQLPDPTFEAHLGVGNVTAYRGRSYFVINGLKGTAFGNSVPILQVLAAPQASITLKQITEDILSRCGIDPGTCSTWPLTQTVEGFTIEAQADGVTVLQPLALVFDFDISEVGGGLRCVPRGRQPLATITADQLAGHEGGAARPSYKWPRDPELQMPRRAAITFIDPARDCQQNTQSDARETGSAQSNLTVQVPITMTSDNGRKVAARLLWEATTGRQQIQAQTDDRLGWIESARTFAIECPFGYETIRITKRTRGANQVIEFEGKRDAPSIYVSSAPSADANAADNPLGLGGPVNPPFFIEPPSSFPGVSGAVLQIALSGGDGTIANDAWGGCQVYSSSDDVTSDYVLEGVAIGPACMGKLSANLPSYGGGNPDNTNTLSVDTSESGGEPQSISTADAAASQVIYYVGGEYLSAANVSAVGGDVYNLTKMWRGLLGTSKGSHSTGDPFVMIAGLFSMPIPKNWLGTTRYFRFVSAGENLASVTTYSHAFTGNGYGTALGGAPAAPGALTTSPSSNGNVVSIPAADVNDNVQSYTVYRANGTGASFGSASPVGNVAAVAGAPTTFPDPTAQAGASYTYFAVATNGVSSGANSPGANQVTALPVGAAAPATAAENLTAGAVCHQFDAAGVRKVELANATDLTKPADCFVLSSASLGASVTAYAPGQWITGLSSLSPGATYWLDITGGQITTTPPSSSGNGTQIVGWADDTGTKLFFDPRAMVGV